MFNESVFLPAIRNAPFGGSLTTKQIEGTRAILDRWEKEKLRDERWLAYMLATAFHETAHTMQPVRETLASSDAKAIAILDKAFAQGKLPWVKTPYWRRDKNGKSWLGRGLVQLTHEANYRRMSEPVGVDLVARPERAMEMPVALDIMFEGMLKGKTAKGDFTGKSLENYFNNAVEDPVGARKIINGTDKAKLIAGYYKNFLDALRMAQSSELIAALPVEVPEEAKPDDVPPVQSKSLWTILSGLFGAGGLFAAKDVMDGGTNLLNAVDDGWSFLALLAVLLTVGAGGLLIYLAASGRLQILRSKAVK